MCHQTVGLISRALEAAGIATTSVSTTRDITAAARPPRAVFVDFPNGNTTGKVNQPELTRSILESAFAQLSVTDGEVLVDLDHVWADDDAWKDTVFRREAKTASGEVKVIDDRVERFDTPQYQTDADENVAAETHTDQDCLVCIGIDF